MRPALERLRLIERHLRQELSPSEAATWQAQLLRQPELHQEVAVQQALYQSLQLAGRQQLRQELAAIHVRLYPPRRRSWWRAAAAWLGH